MADRIAELEALVDEMLSTYVSSMTPNAARSLVTPSRLAGWRAVRNAGARAVAAADELSELGHEIQGAAFPIVPAGQIEAEVAGDWHRLTHPEVSGD